MKFLFRLVAPIYNVNKQKLDKFWSQTTPIKIIDFNKKSLTSLLPNFSNNHMWIFGISGFKLWKIFETVLVIIQNLISEGPMKEIFSVWNHFRVVKFIVVYQVNRLKPGLKENIFFFIPLSTQLFEEEIGTRYFIFVTVISVQGKGKRMKQFWWMHSNENEIKGNTK